MTSTIRLRSSICASGNRNITAVKPIAREMLNPCDRMVVDHLSIEVETEAQRCSTDATDHKICKTILLRNRSQRCTTRPNCRLVTTNRNRSQVFERGQNRCETDLKGTKQCTTRQLQKEDRRCTYFVQFPYYAQGDCASRTLPKFPMWRGPTLPIIRPYVNPLAPPEVHVSYNINFMFGIRPARWRHFFATAHESAPCPP